MSLLAEEERRVAEERRQELASGSAPPATSSPTCSRPSERRVEERLRAWSADLERAQQDLETAADAKLEQRQRP